MPAMIRQQYVSPTIGNKLIREINIDTEIICPEDYNASSDLLLKAEMIGHHHHGSDLNIDVFEKVYLNPKELVDLLVDGKRSYRPKNCLRSSLKYKANKGENTITLENNNANLQIGDVFIILSDLKGGYRTCAFADDIENNTITFHCGQNGLPRTFFKGALVQNLSNRWNEEITIIGAKSQLKRPQPAPCVARSYDDKIDIVINNPINPGTLKYYDVYVRNHDFKNIETHWIPDIADLSIEAEECVIETFNGGEEAGGGILQNKETYYVALIAKDDKGRDNVNESEAIVYSVLI